MLKKIILENFFAFQGKHEVDLHSGINLLLGINGSGKSSFLRAISLLYEGVVGIGFGKLFQEQWGGFNQVVNCRGGEANLIRLTYVFDSDKIKSKFRTAPFSDDVTYSISIHPLGTTNYTMHEKLFTPNHSDTRRPFKYIDFKNGVGFMSTREDGNIEYKKNELSGQELVLRQVVDPARFFPSYVIRQTISEIGIFNGFDTSASSALRRPSEYSAAKRLYKNAANLPQLLNDLSNENRVVYKQIDDALVKVNPNYIGLNFKSYASQLYLSLEEKDLGRTIGAMHISDGTLKYLIYMVMLCNPNREMLLGIDEPETGLHPDMIRSIAERMKEAAVSSQLFVATHSPLLVNHFELDDLLIFEKDGKNNAVVRELEEEEYEEWIDKGYLPGQLWVNGVIGGKRW